MCVAGLNVAAQPCGCRWYGLIRSCNPGMSLANCSERLRLEGWETRKESCPWCTGPEKDVRPSTHRLLSATSPTEFTASSASSPEPFAAQTHRSGSSSTLSSLSRNSSSASVQSARGQRHRDDRLRNDRFNMYLTMSPHEVLPSARKNYPTTNASRADEAAKLNAGSTMSANSGLGKGWKKSVRFSRAMFKG